MTKKKSKGKKPARGAGAVGGRGRSYPFELRVQVVKATREGNAGRDAVARAFRIGSSTVANWLRLYDDGGYDALRPSPRPPPPRRADTIARTTRRDAVIATRTANPEWGTRRIRDVLERFEALGVDEHAVRRILHEAGLIEPTRERVRREPQVRRFERAEPNQLWQSDIFTLLLRRHERLYVAAFMDDHSRFLVSHAVAHHQKSDLVMEALRRGVASYGAPREILPHTCAARNFELDSRPLG